MISLILPPDRWNDMHFPIGLLSLSASLSARGYENNVLDSALLWGSKSHDRDKLILDNIVENKVRIVGISSFIHEQNYVTELTKKIKSLNKSIFVIAGGPQPTVRPEYFLHSGVDLVVRGEAEDRICKIIDEVNDRRDFYKIDGVSFLFDGRIVNTSPAELIDDLNSLEIPAYEKSNISHYSRISSKVIRGVPLRVASIMTSRGCPFSCSYCMGKLITGRRVRFREASRIYDEVKKLRDKFGFEAVYFLDDTLGVSKTYVQEICQVMKELGMLWGAQERVNTINEKSLREMRGSGCVQIDFGIESGSNRILNEIANKNISVEMSRSALRMTGKNRLRTFSNFMIGFPTETEQEMGDTFKLAKEIRSNEYFVSILLPLPGTPIWDMVKPEISDSEFFKLNFFGGKLLNLYNRSEVRDLEKMRTAITNSLYIRSRIRKLFRYWEFIAILLRKNKREIFKRIAVDLFYELGLLKGQVIFTLRSVKLLQSFVLRLRGGEQV
jgi:magnesium-protoporphyrin IX monomethyl ester (oxidative) cyclase